MKLCWIIYFFFINMRKEKKKHVNHFLVLQIQGKALVKCALKEAVGFICMDFFFIDFFFQILCIQHCIIVIKLYRKKSIKYFIADFSSLDVKMFRSLCQSFSFPQQYLF